jgi:hypothetical protein
MASLDPLAVRICCLPLPKKSPEMASCVADGCFTVKAYRDMEEKLVMMGDGGHWPSCYRRVDMRCNVAQAAEVVSGPAKDASRDSDAAEDALLVGV